MRISPSLYLEVRDWLLEHDPDGPALHQWAAREIGPPASLEDMACEIIWIILCAGRSAQAARTIYHRVLDALHSGRPVVEAFGYRAKAAAIESAWSQRERHFDNLQAVLKTNDGDNLVAWCRSNPFVGDDTQFQLAKNFGADVCKPDIWLCRLAGIPDRPRRSVKYRYPICRDLCQTLALSSGDRIAVIDTMLWLACNKRVLRVTPDAGPVTFVPGPIRVRPVNAPVDSQLEMPV